jgi:regulator of RNase E activity RraA
MNCLSDRFWGKCRLSRLKPWARGDETHGGVRDLTEVGALSFQFFAVCIMAVRVESPVIDTNCTVRISGMTVNPGDLIHADFHGAVMIPQPFCGLRQLYPGF